MFFVVIVIESMSVFCFWLICRFFCKIVVVLVILLVLVLEFLNWNLGMFCKLFFVIIFLSSLLDVSWFCFELINVFRIFEVVFGINLFGVILSCWRLIKSVVFEMYLGLIVSVSKNVSIMLNIVLKIMKIFCCYKILIMLIIDKDIVFWFEFCIIL